MWDTTSNQLKQITSNSPGGVAAVNIDRNNTGFHFFGDAGLKKDTIFEIGSVTKVFTALLLVVLENEGVVNRTDSIEKYLNINFSDSVVGKITLEQLALHTSGLPKLPSNLSPEDESDPYANYSKDDLYEFLKNHQSAAGYPGGEKQYSNTGFALLGHALALAADDTYENLLQEHILAPLGMQDTSCYLSDKKRERLAQGHNDEGEEVGRWHNKIMQGDGALVSTPADMEKFLRMCCGTTDSSLTSLVDDMCADYAELTGKVGVQQVLGWLMVTPKDNGRLFIGKGGGTSGFRSFIGFTIDKKRAIALMANQRFDISPVAASFLSGK